jgi:Domain of unknown function (DUF4507)
LNAIQDLQVIEILLKFFGSQPSEPVRHAVLKALFSRASDDERQISLLTKFLSMALGVKNSNVLNSAAVWMQVGQVGDRLHCNDCIKSQPCN